MKYLIFFILLFLVFLVYIYNLILLKENRLKNAFSCLDIILKKRFDLIPNLVSIVKKYAEYESDILKEVVLIRNDKCSVSEVKKEIELNRKLDDELEKINLLIENYPNLKSSKNFIKLQESLAEIEDEVSAARRMYNAHCTVYNTFIQMFPINIFAFIFGFKCYMLFEIPENERTSKKWI